MFLNKPKTFVTDILLMENFAHVISMKCYRYFFGFLVYVNVYSVFQYFYSLKDISVGGLCICYGHAKWCQRHANLPDVCIIRFSVLLTIFPITFYGYVSVAHITRCQARAIITLTYISSLDIKVHS